MTSAAVVAEVTASEMDAVWSLWLQTGWNEKYQVDRQRFIRSWGQSHLSRCIFRDDRLVAIARVNSDGLMYAMIHDVVVDPEYRGLGLGALIIRSLLQELQKQNISCVQLMAADDQSAFYEKLGFRPRPGNKPGMELFEWPTGVS